MAIAIRMEILWDAFIRCIPLCKSIYFFVAVKLCLLSLQWAFPFSIIVGKISSSSSFSVPIILYMVLILVVALDEQGPWKRTAAHTKPPMKAPAEA